MLGANVALAVPMAFLPSNRVKVLSPSRRGGASEGHLRAWGSRYVAQGGCPARSTASVHDRSEIRPLGPFLKLQVLDILPCRCGVAHILGQLELDPHHLLRLLGRGVEAPL
jgi:hypothetical protein